MAAGGHAENRVAGKTAGKGNAQQGNMAGSNQFLSVPVNGRMPAAFTRAIILPATPSPSVCPFSMASRKWMPP
jgi:hypothetical protein